MQRQKGRRRQKPKLWFGLELMHDKRSFHLRPGWFVTGFIQNERKLSFSFSSQAHEQPINKSRIDFLLFLILSATILFSKRNQKLLFWMKLNTLRRDGRAEGNVFLLSTIFWGKKEAPSFLSLIYDTHNTMLYTSICPLQRPLIIYSTLSLGTT